MLLNAAMHFLDIEVLPFILSTLRKNPTPVFTRQGSVRQQPLVM